MVLTGIPSHILLDHQALLQTFPQALLLKLLPELFLGMSAKIPTENSQEIFPNVPLRISLQVYPGIFTQGLLHRFILEFINIYF